MYKKYLKNEVRSRSDSVTEFIIFVRLKGEI